MAALVRNLPYNQKFYDALDASLENFSNSEGINAYKFLAAKLGFQGADKEKNLYRKLSEMEINHRLYADELILILEELGVYSAPVGHYLVSFCMNHLEQPQKLSLSQSVSALSKIFGNFNAQFIEAMADGRITDIERNGLLPMLDDYMAKLQRMRMALTPAPVANPNEAKTDA